MDPRFELFIQEKKYLRNVSPATEQWYRASLKWLRSPTPDEAALKDLVMRMRHKRQLSHTQPHNAATRRMKRSL